MRLFFLIIFTTILDDDLSVRLRMKKIKINRPPRKHARFKMMRHKQQRRNKKVGTLLQTAVRFEREGLNSIQYTVVKVSLYTGFTHILVDVGVNKGERDLNN